MRRAPNIKTYSAKMCSDTTRIAALQKCVVYSNLTAVLFILSVSKVFEVTNIGHLKENVYTVVKFNVVTSRGRANVLEDIGWRSK